MKKNINIACGLSAVSLLAFALVACETENLSAPTGTPCNCKVQSSSSWRKVGTLKTVPQFVPKEKSSAVFVTAELFL